MKKQTKVLATLSAAALLAVGFTAVSFAEGWDNSTGSWQYLNKDGEAVVDEWKTSNGQKFYLGDDGNMVTNSLIEDTSSTKTQYYYVDANGAMVTNTWKAVALDGDENTDLDAEYWWYYFGSDGKAYRMDDGKTLSKGRVKTINGLKYAFDEEGHMLYGWINASDLNQNDSDDKAWETADWYFNGWNDGHAATGWQQIDVVNDDDEDKTYWFHFNSYGKKDKGRKKINGKYYHLDSADGHMVDEWDTAVATKSTTTSSTTYLVGTGFNASTSTADVRYLNGDGAERKSKWVWAIPDEDWIPDDYNDDEYSWFYFDKGGKLTTTQIKKINGKSYAFDKLGRMQTGLVAEEREYDSAKDSAKKTWKSTSVAEVDDWDKMSRDEIMENDWAALTKNGVVNDQDTKNLYYFNENEETDGRRMTGYQKLGLDDGDYQFYFDSKTGKAATGYVKKIKKYTINGLVIEPTSDDENNYWGLKVTEDANGVHIEIHKTASDMEAGDIVVNKSGTKVTSSQVKDENGYYIHIKNGVFDYAELDE